jgi:hypothetical protein
LFFGVYWRRHKEFLMRYLVPAFLVLSMMAVPACAQSQSSAGQDNRPTATQSRTANPPQEQSSQAKTPSDPTPQATPDNSMADFNVLGSTAQAAFGHDGP